MECGIHVTALAGIASGLQAEAEPLLLSGFKTLVNQVIYSIEKLGKDLDDFQQKWPERPERLLAIASHLAIKEVKCSGHAFTEMRTLLNRLKRLHGDRHTSDDVHTIVALHNFVCDSELFIEEDAMVG